MGPKRKSVKNKNETIENNVKKTKFDDTFSDLLTKFASSDDDQREEARKSGKRLKALLSDHEQIRQFVENPNNVEVLVSVFARQTSVLGSELYFLEVHQYSISILANISFAVNTVGFLFKKANRNFLDLCVRIFENTTANIEVKASTCRLIGNLCSNKDLMTSWMSSNTIIFDRIALLLEFSNSQIVKQCLRIFSILVNSSFTRVLMLSNGGFYLGKLLENEQYRDEVIKILKILLKRHTKVLDRQLSSSNGCSRSIVDLFFDETTKHRKFVIDVFTNTVCIREQMETEDFITRLMESELLEKSQMLAAFSQTAWGRAKLRTSGGLDFLIDVLSKSIDNDERLAIVTSFRHFVHDTAGMRHLGENQLFVNTVVRDINQYVESNKNECQPSIDMEFVEKLSRRLEELSEDNETSSNEFSAQIAPTTARLHKDFYSMWSYDTPQTSPKRIINSASVSPIYFSPSPSYSFPSSQPSSGASSPNTKTGGEGILDELSDIESDNEKEEENEKIENEKNEKKRKEKMIIEGELWLLTWQSQDDHNLQFLIRSDVLDCVISYLRNTSQPEFRTYRILRRMATLRTHVYHLLDLQFHIRILTELCASPCRMLKYSKLCKKCEASSEHGRDILREFASHVDNSYGDAHINSQFVKDDFLNRTKAAIAKIVLIKERIRLAKVPALNELFDSLAHILNNFEEFGRCSTYENGPSLCSQIIGALSILISGQRIRELCENDSWYFPPTNADDDDDDDDDSSCTLLSQTGKGDDDELLTFIDANETKIVSAPMSKICENSEYFEAMFHSNFVEKTRKIRNFQLDSDKNACPSHDFQVFIHLLSGCTSSCSAVESAQQCANLLGLSDHYLCHKLSEMLCSNQGPLRTYLNGQSLSILLPIALTTNAHPTLLDTVFLTLIRFASPENVTNALEQISKNRLLIDIFIGKLRQFLTNKV